ncbi:unnamed protein product, partial [marine sediment metagenome]
MRDERGHWYLLTGFVIGIVLGLVYAWLIAPQQYQDRDTSPASLQPEFKDQYRAMIAAAYVATGNLPRAEARLELLDDDDVVHALAEQAQRTLGEGDSPLQAQALGLLAVALGQGESALIPTTIPTETTALEQTSNTPQITNTITAPAEKSTSESAAANPSLQPPDLTPQATRTSNLTSSPLPTRTPTVTPGTPFVLQENNFVCDTKITGPLIQIFAENSSGQQLSNREINVTWEEGEDYFYTGLKPEIGPGYADF